MKKMFLMSFAVLALLATASFVMAQPPAGGQRGQGGAGGGFGQGGAGQGRGQQAFAGSVLGIAEARTALGVTEEQWQKLQDASAAIRTANPAPQGAPGQGPGAAPNADPAARAAAQARQAKIAEETRKQVEAILSKDQVEKLDVMTFQRTGGLNPPAPPTAPNTPGGPGAGGFTGFGGGGNAITVDSLRALKLTDAQVKKVQEAITKRTEALGSTTFGGGGNPMTPEERTARREATQKITNDFFAAVKAALTPAQIAKAEELMKDVPAFLTARPGGPGNANAPGAGGTGTRGGGAGAGTRGAGTGTGAGRGTGAGGAGRTFPGAGN